MFPNLLEIFGHVFNHSLAILVWYSDGYYSWDLNNKQYGGLNTRQDFVIQAICHAASTLFMYSNLNAGLLKVHYSNVPLFGCMVQLESEYQLFDVMYYVLDQ